MYVSGFGEVTRLTLINAYRVIGIRIFTGSFILHFIGGDVEILLSISFGIKL